MGVRVQLASDVISKKSGAQEVWIKGRTIREETSLTNSAEKPCQNCRSANVQCIYADRERVLTVSESYLRELEADRDRARRDPHSPSQNVRGTEGHNAGQALSTRQTGTNGENIIENSAAEAFLAKVHQLRQNAANSAPTAPLSGADEGSTRTDHLDIPQNSAYEYSRLIFETSRKLNDSRFKTARETLTRDRSSDIAKAATICVRQPLIGSSRNLYSQ